MIITFLTVISVIYVVWYICGFLFMIYEYSQMTPRQQSVATYNIPGKPLIGMLLAVSFLITRIFY